MRPGISLGDLGWCPGVSWGVPVVIRPTYPTYYKIYKQEDHSGPVSLP